MSDYRLPIGEAEGVSRSAEAKPSSPIETDSSAVMIRYKNPIVGRYNNLIELLRSARCASHVHGTSEPDAVGAGASRAIPARLREDTKKPNTDRAASDHQKRPPPLVPGTGNPSWAAA